MDRCGRNDFLRIFYGTFSDVILWCEIGSDICRVSMKVLGENVEDAVQVAADAGCAAAEEGDRCALRASYGRGDRTAGRSAAMARSVIMTAPATTATSGLFHLGRNLAR